MPPQVPDPRLYLAAIIQSSDDAIASKDLDGIVTSWNRGAERVFGYSAEEMIGQSITQIVPKDRLDEERAVLAKIRNGETVAHFETVRCRKDGQLIDISLTVSPIRDDDGRIIGASKIARDITSQKALEIERVQLLRARAAIHEDASRLKDEFLATLSHELRTPLNAIVGWSHLLSTGKLNPTQVESAIEVIRRNARAQTRIIEDLLDVSRIVKGQMRLNMSPIDVRDIVTNTMQALRPTFEGKSLHASVRLDPGSTIVLGDADRLQQVLSNVLSNAVKFTPPGGSIEAHVRSAGGKIAIDITDSGIGIAPALLPYVFDRFWQASSSQQRTHGGLGLGLSIVRDLVDMHAGSVRVHSDGEGKGARVTIELPTARTTPPQPQHAAGSSHVRLDDLRVLIVDDMPDDRAMLKQLLESHGAAVRTASSADEGLARIDEEIPDVLVSDIAMPIKDGHQMLSELRRRRDKGLASLPAIALTAHARDEDRERALDAGFQHYVAKPVDGLRFIDLVAAIAARSPTLPA